MRLRRQTSRHWSHRPALSLGQPLPHLPLSESFGADGVEESVAPMKVGPVPPLVLRVAAWPPPVLTTKLSVAPGKVIAVASLLKPVMVRSCSPVAASQTFTAPSAPHGANSRPLDRQGTPST